MYALRFKDKPYHDGSYQPQAAEPSHQYPFHYLDGVTLWLSPTEINPDDDFLGSVTPEELVGEDGEREDD